MAGKVYLSLEGELCFLYIPSKGKVFRLGAEELPGLLERLKANQWVIAVHLEGLQVLRFPIPVRITPSGKGAKVISTIIRTEVQKRIPESERYLYTYDLADYQARTFATVYLAPRENLTVVEELIKGGANVVGCYPNFLPVIQFVATRDSEVKGRIIFLISGNRRFLFITEGRQLLLQRSFLAERDFITPEDSFEITGTMNYAIQNLRLGIDEIIILGKEAKIEGIGVPVRFFLPQEVYDLPLIPFLTSKYEVALKRFELFPQEYTEYRRIRKLIKYSEVLLLLLMFVSAAFSAHSFLNYLRYSDILEDKRRMVSFMQSEIPRLQSRAKELEARVIPLVELLNKKNSLCDSREFLYKLSDLSKIDRVSIEAIEVSPDKKTVVKIQGLVHAESYESREKFFKEMKTHLLKKGFRISDERWDLTKGGFIITLEHET